MWKNKMIIEPKIKQKILFSKVLNKNEKNNFLRFINYLTPEEREELLLVI